MINIVNAKKPVAAQTVTGRIAEEVYGNAEYSS